MAATLFTFAQDLQKFAEHVDIEIATVVQKICSDLFTRIVGNFESHRHPVDTGRARAGWAISIGTPAFFLPATVPQSLLNERAAKKRKGEKPEPIFPLPGDPDVSAIDGTQQVFILNNLPYIEALENGHSQQAPNGMVKLSLLEVEAEIGTLLKE